jgi:hypothetical protein
MKIVFVFLFSVEFLLSVNVYSQKVDAKFHFYIRKDSYSDETPFKNNDLYRFYQVLGQSSIDPLNQSIVNKQLIKKNLDKLYPDKNAAGILSIDLENDAFKNLQIMNFNDNKFNDAADQFVQLINEVRMARPNLQIGIYGLPFRTYYTYQNYWNNNQKLDKILNLCDFISPSLYILFTDKEKGSSANEKYLRQNLQVALEYGKRLNKPVIPFIWYMINPGNKLHGGEIIEKQDMLNYISIIRNYDIDGTKVKGVFWWEGSEKLTKKIMKIPRSLSNVDSNKIKDKIIIDYTRPLLYH